MATPSRDNSPQRAPLLIRRSLTTVIRKGVCYSIELHVVAQPGRCPAVGKFPLQRAVDPTNSVDLPSKHPAQRNDRRSAKRRRPDTDETNCARADQCLEGKCRPPVLPGEAQAAPNISKRAKILEMIRRSGGATLSEIGATTGWQAHSIRSFVSTLAKRDHIRIRSLKNQAGERVYQIRA
jgi:hypothetical protein